MTVYSQRNRSYADAMAHAQETADRWRLAAYVYSTGTRQHPRFDVVCGDDEYGAALRVEWQVAQVLPARVCDRCGLPCTETTYEHHDSQDCGPYTTEHARHATCQAAMDAEAEAWAAGMDAAHDEWLASLTDAERADHERYVVQMDAEYDAAQATAAAAHRAWQ